MFGRGVNASPRISGDLRNKLRSHQGPRDYFHLLRQLPLKAWHAHRRRRLWPREKGYLYFQDFLPNNTKDTRVTVIGDRAFAYTRGVRPHDFRASGSGRLNYDLGQIDIRCVELAHRYARRIGGQSMAFDFIHDRDGQPAIVEVCFGYVAKLVHDCPGHWDRHLNWHDGPMWPQDAIFSDFLHALEKRHRHFPQPVAENPPPDRRRA
jgi:hypothetical protein